MNTADNLSLGKCQQCGHSITFETAREGERGICAFCNGETELHDSWSEAARERKSRVSNAMTALTIGGICGFILLGLFAMLTEFGAGTAIAAGVAFVAGLLLIAWVILPFIIHAGFRRLENILLRIEEQGRK